MSITLNWNNRGQAVTAVKIYRSKSRIEPLTLLATVDGPATTYEDTTAMSDTLYYYKVALVIGVEEVPGSLKPMMAPTNLGPGPQTLLSGNMEFGYFGKMLPTEFFSSSGLRAAIGTAPTYWATYSTDITWWRKYAYFGKIVYAPDVPIYQTTSVNSTAIMALYSAGMLYGHGKTNKNAAITVADTVQDKKVISGAFEFIIKAPAANVYTDPTTSYFDATASINYYGSEAMLIAQPAVSVNSGGVSQGLMLPKVSPADTYASNVTGVLTQHMASATQFCVQYNFSANRSTTGWTGQASIQYLPILQLVP